MSVAAADAGTTSTQADPVVEDMSITLLAGRVKSSARGITDAQKAEALGFRRVWVPERYNIKEAGMLLGAMGASTSRIGIGSGPLSAFSRPPIVTAAMAATAQSLFGERFTLGLGRSEAAWIGGHGFGQASYQGIVDYARIVKQLWAGELVDYDGPAGRCENLRMIDRPEEAPPAIVFFHVGGPKASRTAADPVFDQVALCNLTSAEHMHRSIEQTKREAERIGRDPESIHFIAPVTVAADMSEEDTLIMVAARIVLGIQLPQLGQALITYNGWEESWINEIRNHPQFANVGQALLDHAFHRDDVLDPARLVPERWLRKSAAVGTARECAELLQVYLDAGAHEIDIYSGSPDENESLIEAWRNRPEATK